MALFLVENTSATAVTKTEKLVVAAETAADAREFAASHFNGDASWADATATALTEETLDAANSMVGYVWTISITGGTQTEDPIEVQHVGAGSDDLDAVAAALVILLNAHAEIANAAYVAPDLTVSGVADGMGDATLILKVQPPSGNTQTDLSAMFVGAGGFTHEGIAAAVLEVALVADTQAKPEVVAEA